MGGLNGLKIRATRVSDEHLKCPRCWHYHTIRENHDNLCDRCCVAIVEGWPEHESVPHILASREAQRLKYTVL